ncbi:hypothetical protein J3Q64DRAFT_1643857 [Phycomyces blakesleeanus]|uniref:F-box domain-containing protein n=1 Tax=Phycomyces blakesleeanus TaxID=4837 RepID=A0ABR3AR92_PHYBL
MNPSSSITSELDEFRDQWRKEVESQKVPQPHEPTPPIQEPLVQQTESLKLEPSDDEIEEEPMVTAMDFYIAAADLEKQGQLQKAIIHYRRAFKLNPEIDYEYKHHQATVVHSEPKVGNSSTEHIHPEDPQFRHAVPIGTEYKALSTRKDPLEDLIKLFQSQDLHYQPAIEYKPVLIAKLPNEVIQHILRHLVLRSVSSVARFALVCKNFFLFTRSPSLWKFACEHAFRTPEMSLEDSQWQQHKHVQVYEGNWMRMFIERPRIRYDGVYISTCQYVRPGISDSSWGQPFHMVTYYRYLRFFPNGDILKHVSTDKPAQVVRLLTPQFVRKQIFNGHFELDKEKIYIEMQDRTLPREEFRMSLTIKSTHRGRHNKLAWIEYNSNAIDQEGAFPYDLKLMKPYFFSPSLYVAASVMDVNFNEKSYKVHFLIQPNGTLANAYGQLSQPIIVSFPSGGSHRFEAGDTVDPIRVEFSYDFGTEMDYPFDQYSGYFELYASYANDTIQGIPITFHLEASLSSFSFTPTLESLPNEPDRVGLKIVTGRSTTTLGFSIFVCTLMWALTLIMSLFGYQVAVKKRRVDAHACMIGITMLFALPALRSAQPGIPEVGCTSDVLGFYWNMAIIASASITVIVCWVARWNETYDIHEQSHSHANPTELPKQGSAQHIEHVVCMPDADDYPSEMDLSRSSTCNIGTGAMEQRTKIDMCTSSSSSYLPRK